MDPLAKSFNPNKHLKQQFVSNLTGSSMLEIVALSTIVPLLGIVMLSDYIPASETSALEKAFDGNLLGSFLVANILTGLVNLFADTLFASSSRALVILVIYSFTLSAVTGLMDLALG